MSQYHITVNSDRYNYEYFQQDDICRFCWSKDAEREILSNNTENSTKFKNELIDKIRYCLNIDVTEINHPNKACENCYELLEKFHEFKVICSETHKKLQEIISRKTSNDSLDIVDNSCVIKVEKDDIENHEYIKSQIDVFHDSDAVSDSETSQKCDGKTKSKMKSRYKPVRTPTYCNICRSDFKSMEIFTDHNSVYHGIEKGGLYKCFGCEKRFKSRKTRLGHEIHYCKGLQDGYQCNVCNRYLPKRRMYENHMRNHRENIQVELPEDIFKCLKCYKLFNTKISLRNHMEVHNAEKKKNFVCESCGRVFTRQDYLHKHQLTHTGEKQHVCPHCGFRTTQKSSLTVHIRKHTGERPYSCDVCPQRCISSSNLRAHRRRHLGLKKYECTICCKKFGYKLSLEEHVASCHERAQPHACTHCGALYSRARGLRRHLLAKHLKHKTELQKNELTNIFMNSNENQPNSDSTKVDNILKEVEDMHSELTLKTQDFIV
ncbi:zinc finger protein OZF-like [Battus philenor]|uniref:zinc finger protein OZF-like n=1 Tax=Battus philenor TaxID=42288 RepID=UPI0035D035A9